MYVEVLSIKSPAWKRYFKLMSEHLLLYLKNIFENYKTICHYHMTFHRNEGFGSYVQMNFAAPVIKEKNKSSFKKNSHVCFTIFCHFWL